jgi:hypothetical protein
MTVARTRNRPQLFARAIPNHHLIATIILLGLTVWLGARVGATDRKEGFLFLAAAVYLTNVALRQLTLRVTADGVSSLGLFGRRLACWADVTDVQEVRPRGRGNAWRSQSTMYVCAGRRRVVVELDYFDDPLSVRRFLEAQRPDARTQRAIRAKISG